MYPRPPLRQYGEYHTIVAIFSETSQHDDVLWSFTTGTPAIYSICQSWRCSRIPHRAEPPGTVARRDKKSGSWVWGTGRVADTICRATPRSKRRSPLWSRRRPDDRNESRNPPTTAHETVKLLIASPSPTPALCSYSTIRGQADQTTPSSPCSPAVYLAVDSAYTSTAC